VKRHSTVRVIKVEEMSI